MVNEKIKTALAFSENAAEQMMASMNGDIPDGQKAFVRVFRDILAGVTKLIETKNFSAEEVATIITFASGGRNVDETRNEFGLTKRQATAFTAQSLGNPKPLVSLFASDSEGVTKSTHFIGIKFLEQIVDRMLSAEEPKMDEIKEYQSAIKFLNDLVDAVNEDSPTAEIDGIIANLYTEFNEKELFVEVD